MLLIQHIGPSGINSLLGIPLEGESKEESKTSTKEG
jgi:hypothetical protein